MLGLFTACRVRLIRALPGEFRFRTRVNSVVAQIRDSLFVYWYLVTQNVDEFL